MEPFEYVIVLISIILGLGIAQLLNGIADMLAQFKKTKFSVAHSIFVVVLFFVFFQDWWYTFQYSREIEQWSQFIVLALVSFPIALFMLARFMFPTGSRSQETDMYAYFSENWRWLYAIFASTILISIVQNITISGYTFTEQIPLMLYFTWYVVFISLNIQNQKYHNAFQIAQLLLWIYFFAGVDNGMLN
ncbi:hypothetical protein N7E81_02905 [Reichenbachiella carrageenanivorans]|uniref:Uncharacterized protein n=1 Tax=Reichenbachiella carrageenanivorans TaxID=2979869 RepID=A0ABY6D1L3_9BACT|nr:hypothetical protein [Reichenbachiella carrageenanivorans]UXX80054.1 hypothetical protein N7E81_02905 [Reichenbachiella carrageenanivorans]